MKRKKLTKAEAQSEAIRIATTAIERFYLRHDVSVMERNRVMAAVNLLVLGANVTLEVRTP